MTTIDVSLCARGIARLRALPYALRALPYALRALSCALVLVAGCAPSPRNVPCSNAGDCEKAGPEYHYCLQSRCVECLSSSSCGEGNSCVDGACEIRCADDRGCPAGSKCTAGECAR